MEQTTLKPKQVQHINIPSVIELPRGYSFVQGLDMNGNDVEVPFTINNKAWNKIYSKQKHENGSAKFKLLNTIKNEYYEALKRTSAKIARKVAAGCSGCGR